VSIFGAPRTTGIILYLAIVVLYQTGMNMFENFRNIFRSIFTENVEIIHVQEMAQFVWMALITIINFIYRLKILCALIMYQKKSSGCLIHLYIRVFTVCDSPIKSILPFLLLIVSTNIEWRFH
jgi:hypothetical protein